MITSLKRVLSKRAIVIVLALLLVMTGFNTYLILEGTRSSNSSNVVNFDFVLSQDGGNYRLKNMLTGYVAHQDDSASASLNAALSEGKSVYINEGTYSLNGDVYITNKLNAKIVGNEATIQGNGHKIVVYGDNYITSQYTTISGLTLINATIRVENTLAATIENSKFINSSVGIEFANTNTWSEYHKIENCQFINDTQGIAFRTPVSKNPQVSNATGSYASSQIERCSFNIQDNSIGINVEQKAEFSDSQLQDVRFWMGESGVTNQTALYVDGGMDQTLLFGVVFESFASEPNNLFAIDLGKNCNPAPVIDGGVSFLGNWTARMHNPFGIWLSADGAVFERIVSVPVGASGQFGANKTIDCHPAIISSFKPKITVLGDFNQNETVTVRIRIEYLDNVVSNPVSRTFTNSGTAWLTDEELMALYPSQGVIWAIVVEAKTNVASTDATVSVGGYGTTG
jgi:hypothetical protein